MAALVILLAGVKAASAIIVPLLVAILITITITPMFLGMQNHGISAGIALLILVTALVVLSFGGATIVGKSVTNFSKSMPKYQAGLQSQVDSLVVWLGERGMDEPKEWVKANFDPRLAIRTAGTLAGSLTSLLSQTFLILIIVIFILLEAAILPGKFAGLPNVSDKARDKLRTVIANVRHYVGLKTLVSLIVGVLVAGFLYFLDVNNWLFLGLLAFMLNYIPNIGSIIAAIPGVLLALIEHGPGRATVVAIFYIVVNVTIGNGLEPRIMGRGLGLSPMVIVITLLFWGWLLGPIGMLLSVPLTMAVKIALENIEETRSIAILMGTGTPETPPPNGEK